MSHQTASTTDMTDWDRNAATYMAMIGTPNDTIFQQFQSVFWESLGDVDGLAVLDVGCGHGWLTAMLAQKGASVLGVDGSSTLLASAHAAYPALHFAQYNLAEGLPPALPFFDRVIAHMVMMDIPDISRLITAIRQVLKPHGRFVFTLPHPSFFNQSVARDPQTGALHRQVQGYLEPQVWRIASFGGHNHYHRSLSYYVEQLRINNMAVTRLYEPPHIPSTPVAETDRAFYASIPVFLLVEAQPLDAS